MGIRVNDDIGRYFQTRKGLRYGDLLSLLLDMLAILIAREKENGQVGGLIPYLVEGGILSYNKWMILFYL